MGWATKYGYYASSVVTLLTRIESPLKTLRIFLGMPGTLPTEIRLRSSGLRFLIRTPMDAWIIKETCIDQDYLTEIDGLGRDWRVVDIGAGLGDFSVLAGKTCVDGEVHAYEPLQKSFALLEHNLMVNGIHRVATYPKAVASQSGELNIEAVTVEPVTVRTVESAGEASVQAVGLEAVLDALPEGTCDFMKVDCEGGEYDILMHSPPELLGRIHRIALEYHDNTGPHTGFQLAGHLEAHGFHVVVRDNPVHDYLGFIYAERPGAQDGSRSHDAADPTL